MLGYTEAAPSPPSPSPRWGEGSRKLSEASAGSYIVQGFPGFATETNQSFSLSSGPILENIIALSLVDSAEPEQEEEQRYQRKRNASCISDIVD